MNGCFLKFYVSENRRLHHRLAYEWLLEEAKRFGLHGGSAFRALAGFGLLALLGAFSGMIFWLRRQSR